MARTNGLKSYELSNHLGNVLAVVSDRKLAVDDGVYNAAGVKTSSTADGICDYFYPDVLSATDYYAFGAPMPGRQFNNGSYRYGFNGKENDNEVKGTGNSQDYGMRMYDTRLGRFFSVDPLTRKFSELTPYQFGSNRPIDGIDMDGLEYYSVHIRENADGSRSKIGVHNYTNIKQQGMRNVETANGVGPRGDVGVTHVIEKFDKDGKFTGTESFNVKNRHGVYQGENNPRQYWEKPNEKGEYPYDYSLSPISEADANGMQHDKDYDAVGAEGISGVLDIKTKTADDNYIKRAEKVIDKANKGENDAITNKPITKDAKAAAGRGKLFFNLIKHSKDSPENVKKQNNTQDNGHKE